jgi:hypothetical protein
MGKMPLPLLIIYILVLVLLVYSAIISHKPMLWFLVVLCAGWIAYKLFRTDDRNL